MRTTLACMTLLTILIASCATVDSTNHRPMIRVDGDFADWGELGIAPVVVDPEGDAHQDYPEGDLRAIYFARDESTFFFFVAYVGDGRGPELVPRLWLDANGDGRADEDDYQIEVLSDRVRVQPLVGDFEDYFDVESRVASLPGSVEFAIRADDIRLENEVRLSGAITYLSLSTFEYVDRFEERVFRTDASAFTVGDGVNGRSGPDRSRGDETAQQPSIVVDGSYAD